MLTWHTERGKDFIEWISKYKFWNYFGYLATLSIIFTGILFTITILSSAYFALTRDIQTNIQNPKNFLVIPGVNDFLPIQETIPIIIALAIAILIHEFGHGILCRFNNIDIESLGVVLISFLPMGAFVKPNEESQEKASIKGKLQMVSSGIMNNFVFFIISLFLLFIFSTYMIVPMNGGFVTGVYPNSSADDAGLPENKVITLVNNTEVNNTEEMINTMENSGSNFTIVDSEGNKYNISKSLQVTSSTGFLKPRDKIKYVNGERVKTESEFNDIAYRNNKIDIKLENGNSKTIWSGVYSYNKSDNIIILEVDDERVINNKDMNKYKKDNYNVTYVYNNSIKRSNINITKLNFAEGYTGMTLSEVGIIGMNLNNYHSYMNGSQGVLRGGLYTMFGPFANLENNGFSGFVEDIQFYKSIYLPKSIIANIASILFWSAFVNINLMIINSLPVSILDGGHALRYSTQYCLSKITNEKEKIKNISLAVEVIVSISVLLSFFIIIFLA